MKIDKQTRYERAQKKVASIKGFYNHLAAYIIVNTLLFVLRGKFIFVLIGSEAMGNPEFLNWLDWNFFGTPILWGIGLAFHGLKVFSYNPFFGKEWEERQIDKILREDKKEA